MILSGGVEQLPYPVERLMRDNRVTTIFEEGMPGGPAARWVRTDRLRLVTPEGTRRVLTRPQLLEGLDLAAGECCLWWSDSGITRPFTGNAVAKILVGNGDSAAALATAIETPKMALAPRLPLLGVPSMPLMNSSMAI